MKRILFLCGVGGASGAEYCMLNIIRHIDRKKFKPVLMALSGGTLETEIKKMGISFTDLNVSNKSIRGFIDTVKSTLKIILEAFRLAIYIKNNDISLVYSNSHRIGVTGGLAARISQVKSIWHVRDVPTNSLRIFVFQLCSYILADKVILASHAIYNLNGFKEKDKKYAEVVYDGIDVSKFESVNSRQAIEREFSLSPGDPLLTNVGMLISNKGQELFLKSLRSVKKEYPNIKGLIIGEYDPLICVPEEKGYKDKLVNIIQEQGLLDNVVMTGFRKDIPSILSRTDVYVHSAIFEDPFPGVILEAFASKVPVVAFKVGGIAESVIDGVTGFTVTPRDTDALASKIIQILNDKELRKTLGEEGYNTVKSKFQISTTILQVENIINSLISI